MCNNTKCNWVRYFPRFFSGNKGRISRPLINTAATDVIDATHTAGIMSNGAAEPQAPRTAATVDGMSWIEAVFSVISVSTVS